MCQQQPPRSCESFIKAYTLHLKQNYTFTDQKSIFTHFSDIQNKKALYTCVYIDLCVIILKKILSNTSSQFSSI